MHSYLIIRYFFCCRRSAIRASIRKFHSKAEEPLGFRMAVGSRFSETLSYLGRCPPY